MRPVIVHHDVAELIGIDRIPMPQFKFRVCEWLPRQLLGDLDHASSLKRISGLAEVVLHFAPPADSGTRDLRTQQLQASHV